MPPTAASQPASGEAFALKTKAKNQKKKISKRENVEAGSWLSFSPSGLVLAYIPELWPRNRERRQQKTKKRKTQKINRTIEGVAKMVRARAAHQVNSTN